MVSKFENEYLHLLGAFKSSLLVSIRFFIIREMSKKSFFGPREQYVRKLMRINSIEDRVTTKE